MTQPELASRAGFSRATITRMEGDEERSLSPSNIGAVLAALDVDVPRATTSVLRWRDQQFAADVAMAALQAKISPVPSKALPPRAHADILIKVGDALMPIYLGQPYYWDGEPLAADLAQRMHKRVIEAVVEALALHGWRWSVQREGGREAQREEPPLDSPPRNRSRRSRSAA